MVVYNRDTYASFGDIIVVMHDVSRQAEVTDLHYLALRQKDIPGSQIAVHTLQIRKKRSTVIKSSFHHCQ